ncbi:MAG: hypothetical protein PVI57_18165 [Gemmatimonadota bacterium]
MPSMRRQRLRYDGLQYDVRPDGRCRIEVKLEWRGRTFSAVAEGLQPLHGSLRTAAEATLEAAAAATGGRLELSLRGIKPLRAFDVTLIVVAVAAHEGERRYKLLGTKAVEGEEPVEAACRAVLDALNRVLELYVARPPEDDGVDEG